MYPWNRFRRVQPNSAALYVVALLSISFPARDQSLSSSRSALIGIEEIQHEEFEPVVGEQIRSAYDEAVRDPRNANAVGRLGMILQCYQKYEMSELCYRTAHALSPNSFRWAYYSGNVEGLLGHTKEAFSHLHEAIKLDNSYAPARVRLAQLLFEVGDAHQSFREYEESIRLNSHLASAHFGRGRVLAAIGDLPAAIASYRIACELDQKYAAAHYGLAMAYKRTGDNARERAELELYNRYRKNSGPSEDPLIDAVNLLYLGGNTHFARASSLAQAGKMEQAADEYEAALRINPRLMMAHVNLIATYANLGRPEEAEKHFRAALRLDPAWAEVYYNWGLVLYREQKSIEASEAFNRAIEINPSYANAQVQLGEILDDAGNAAEAQRHFQLALESSPGNRRAQYLFGLSLIRGRHYAEAITLLLGTIKVEDGTTPVCLQALSAAYEGSGDIPAAVRYLRLALERATANGMVEFATQLQGDLDRLSPPKAQ